MPKKATKNRRLSADKPILSISNLTIQFVNASSVTTAVDAVDLDVRRGEIVGLVGESGSGKTTVARSVMGLNKYDVGEIKVVDQVLPKDPNKITRGLNKWMARNVQMIFQDPLTSLHPSKRVGSSIAEGLANQKRSDYERKRRARASFDAHISQTLRLIKRGILSSEDAKQALADMEANALADIKSDFPIEIVRDDLEAYALRRHDDVYAARQRDLLDQIAEVYDQLFENKSILRTSRLLARRERLDAIGRKNAGRARHVEASVRAKLELADDNYQRHRDRLLDELRVMRVKYGQVFTDYKEYKTLAKFQGWRAALGEVYDQDFANGRDRLNKALAAGRARFHALNVTAADSGVKETDSKLLRDVIRRETEIRDKADTARGSIRRTVNELLTNVQLSPEYKRRYPNELSGGQQQRIGIARAIAVRPKLLVADEPVSALDVSIQAQVTNIIKDLNEREGLSVLFIAHDLRMVRYISDRIAVMHRGRIVEIGTSEEIYTTPRHPYTINLLKAVPSVDKIGVSLSSKINVSYDRDGDLHWHNVSATHRVLGTEEEGKLWGLVGARKTTSNYAKLVIANE